jgi:hypothetical protein
MPERFAHSRAEDFDSAHTANIGPGTSLAATFANNGHEAAQMVMLDTALFKPLS